MKILAAIHDLMFTSKVTAAAQGRTITWLPRGKDAVEHITSEKPDVLLIDLAARTFDALATVRAVKAADALKDTVVIGYVDHTREDVIEAARAAGADHVLSKGEFARRLPELLQG